MKAEATFKGQKGDPIRKGTMIVLFKPITYDKKDRDGNPIVKDGKTQKGAYGYLQSFTVFNVDQFTDLKLPKERRAEEEKEFVPIEQAAVIFEQYIDRNGPMVRYGYDRACYIPGADVIELPDATQFKTSEEFYATAYHEAAHSTLHESRLNRKGEYEAGVHAFGHDKYSEEELVAEMSSAMLMAHIGIETTFDNSAAYIGSWLKRLKDDKKLVIAAAGKAQKAVDFVLDVKFAAAPDGCVEKETEDE